MKYKVEILPAAWEDLKKIEDCYFINFDVETAIKVSDHILDWNRKVRGLSGFWIKDT